MISNTILKDRNLCGLLTFNIFCIPESFNTNISHKFVDYKVTFVNSQHENINSKYYQHLRLKIPLQTTRILTSNSH